jgi:hypothetical protein
MCVGTETFWCWCVVVVRAFRLDVLVIVLGRLAGLVGGLPCYFWRHGSGPSGLAPGPLHSTVAQRAGGMPCTGAKRSMLLERRNRHLGQVLVVLGDEVSGRAAVVGEWMHWQWQALILPVCLVSSTHRPSPSPSPSP